MNSMKTSRPCISMDYLKAEVKLNFKFDLKTAYYLIKEKKIFKEVKISEKLGLIKVVGQYKLMLFSDGKVSVYPVSDVESAYQTMNYVAKLIFDSRICRETNKVVLNCLKKDEACRKNCSVDFSKYKLFVGQK